MRSALESVDGVEGVEVDYANGTAKVTCSKGADAEAMIEALESTNKYSGKVKN